VWFKNDERLGALSVTTNPKYQAPFAPMIPNVRVGKIDDVSPEALLSLIGEHTCRVIVEPIQGEADVRGTENEVEAVLIYDEIHWQVSCALKHYYSILARYSLLVLPHYNRRDGISNTM
jgi:hypothetical protein